MSRALVVCLLLPLALSLPQASTAARADDPPAVALCDVAEPGERIELSGRILDEQGRPYGRAAVVAYGADKDGLYRPRGDTTRMPRLRGVAVTDAEGRFRFRTVRPGPYPNGKEPAHIHMWVLAPEHRVHYTTFWFEGDPLITPEKLEKTRRDGGDELVVVRMARRADGVLTFHHEIRLRGA